MKDRSGLLNKILDVFSKQEGIDDLLKMAENWDGYKRENAVRRLGMLGNPVAIPVLIVRANDWVLQVRRASIDALESLMNSENVEAFIFCLPELYHLNKCGRDNHDLLIEKVLSYLVMPENSSHLIAAIKHQDPHIARIALNLCIDNELMEKQALVSACINHSDVVVRDKIAYLLRDFTGEVLKSFLSIAIKDVFMPIRREAFQIYLREMPEQGLKIAKQLLFDRHSSIREIAIRKLVGSGTQVDNIYLQVLSSPNQTALQLRSALLGLAYLNLKHVVPEVSRFTHANYASVRKASIQSLAKLMGEEARAYLIQSLTDESPGVAKASVRLMGMLELTLSADELIKIFEKTDVSHKLNTCFMVSRSINKWEWLIFILSVSRINQNSNSAYSASILEQFDLWNRSFNKKSSQPTAQQLKRLRTEYIQAKGLLCGEKRAMLDFTMESLGVVSH